MTNSYARAARKPSQGRTQESSASWRFRETPFPELRAGACARNVRWLPWFQAVFVRHAERLFAISMSLRPPKRDARSGNDGDVGRPPHPSISALRHIKTAAKNSDLAAWPSGDGVPLYPPVRLMTPAERRSGSAGLCPSDAERTGRIVIMIIARISVGGASLTDAEPAICLSIRRGRLHTKRWPAGRAEAMRSPCREADRTMDACSPVRSPACVTVE